MQSADASLRVMLYVAVPTAGAPVPLRKRLGWAIRRWVYKVLDLFSLLLIGRVSLAHFHYRAPGDRNAGDELIRDAIKQQLAKAFAPNSLTFAELEWGMLDEGVVQDVNRNFDLFVIAGSGYFFFDEFGNLPSRVRADADCVQRIAVPKCAVGIGCNHVVELPAADVSRLPEPTSEASSLIGAVCGPLFAISVRDSQTGDLIRSLSGREACVTADPVLFYEHGKLPQRQLRRSQRPRIGINLAVHDRACFAEFTRNFDTLCRLLRGLRQRLDTELVYIGHTRGDAIIPAYFRIRGIPMRVRTPGAAALPCAYDDLDLHISQMMHSAILSIQAGVPTINLAYDVKNHAMFETLQLGEFCLPARDFNEVRVLDLAETIMDDRQAIVLRLQEAVTSFGRRNDAYLARLAGSILLSGGIL